MNLYDRIKPGKRRRGWGGAGVLAAAGGGRVLWLGPLGGAARGRQRDRGWEIPEETAKNPTGVFVRYTFADGSVYQYDTDQIQMNEVRLALGLH